MKKKISRIYCKVKIAEKHTGRVQEKLIIMVIYVDRVRNKVDKDEIKIRLTNACLINLIVVF